MYSFIRALIGVVFLVCSFLVIKKSGLGRKRPLYFACACLSFLLIGTLEFLPFENFFVTFDSPQAAYDYYTFGKPNIELVVEGDNCDLVIDRQSDADHYLIIPKSADGWKIGLGSDTKRVFQKIFDDVIIYAYRYKSTNDYFITVFDTNGGESTVTDEYGTSFLPLETYNEPLKKAFFTYYAYISNVKTPYSITVNGTKIALNDGQSEDGMNAAMQQYYKIYTGAEETDHFYYYYDLFDGEGNVVKHECTYMHEPVIKPISAHVLSVSVQAGTGTSCRQTYYYDTAGARMSEVFCGVLDERDGRILFEKEGQVIIRDIFDKKDFYRELSLTPALSKSPESVISATFSEDMSSVLISYIDADGATVTDKKVRLLA